MIEAMRAGKGPAFLEAVTYRWLGHVDWRDDIDVGVSRSAEELAQWRGRDPVARLEAALSQRGVWSGEEGVALRASLSSEIDAAWQEALRDPEPSPAALLERVYANPAA
jgi:pyruvate dehydrogenase E1 component alpha subunit